MTEQEIVTETLHPREVGPVVLRMHAIDKRYPGVHALRAVSFDVRSGEVHALVGENGAGKSTLVGVAAGSVTADSGDIDIGGELISDPSPKLCREAGLAIVYQEPALLSDLTVAENMRLGMPRALRPSVGEQVSWAAGILAPWQGVAPIDPATPVREMKPDERFVVEIARAMAENPKVIVLDEPTEHLLPAAVAELFSMIAAAKANGSAIVYISHRLNEVKRISDRISVLRDGALEGTFEGSSVSEQDVINLVVGRHVAKPELERRDILTTAPVTLRVDALSGPGFRDVTLAVREGEIVGLAGIEGQGQRDFMRALAGLVKSTGAVTVKDKTASVAGPRRAQRSGIVYLPHDRHTEGVFERLSVADNAGISAIGRFATATFVNRRRERTAVATQFTAMRVKTPSLDTPVESLSGGNQQKVMMSRVLLTAPHILLTDEPTQGVDVGARGEIYDIIRTTSNSGTTVVVLSSSAAELAEICDRVIVFSRGEAVRELVGQHVTERLITEAALTATSAREHANAQVGVATTGLWRRIARSDQTPAAVLLTLTLLLGVVATVQNEFYLTTRNFGLLLPLLGILAFFALAQQVVMMIGGIDLSVGPLAGLLVVVGSFVLSSEVAGGSLAVGFVVVVLVAVAVGALNWSLITLARINPLIATLVTFTFIQGVAYSLRPLPGGDINPQVVDVVKAKVGFVPVFVILAAVLALALEFGLRRTLLGVRLRALGSNADTARKVGVRSKTLTLVAYVSCSVLVVPAAFLLMAQSKTGNATIGDSYVLASIAAVVLGGASLFGGRGSFLGAFMGAVIFVQINTVVQFLGLELYWQLWLLGGLTILAAAFYSKTRSLMEMS